MTTMAVTNPATEATATANVDEPMQDQFPAAQGDLALLAHPVAQRLLQATIPVRLAYVALDGTPRVVSALFHWTGEEIVLSSWPDDPKVDALRQHPAVALTIDTAEAPFMVLSIRGAADVTIVAGQAPESLPQFTRYYGPEQAQAWVERMERMSDHSARIAIRPAWVGVFDFQTRFPGGMARRMGGLAG